MNILKTIWNSIDEVINDCEGIYFILFSELMMDMLHCENPCKESFDDGTLSSVLSLPSFLFNFLKCGIL